MIFFNPERHPYLFAMIMSRTFSVKLFCDKFNICAFPSEGSIFYTPLSVSLFLINFIVLALEYLTKSQICNKMISPSSALVMSIISSVLLKIPSNVF
jgi:hypothetical protein